MAYDISLDEAKAKIWMMDVKTEIADVERILNNAAESIQGTPDREDVIMQGIYTTGNKLGNAWKGMISGFKKANELITGAIEKIASAALAAKNSLESNSKLNG